MFANASRRSRAHVDVPLILMVFAMCFFGIYAVAQRGFRLFLKHLVHVDVQFVQCLLVGIERDEVQDVGV